MHIGPHHLILFSSPLTTWQLSKHAKTHLRGSQSAIFNIDLDLDLNPMFASMEHMHMNRIIFNIDLDLNLDLKLHRSEHRVRVEIKVDIENTRKTTSELLKCAEEANDDLDRSKSKQGRLLRARHFFAVLQSFSIDILLSLLNNAVE